MRITKQCPSVPVLLKAARPGGHEILDRLLIETCFELRDGYIRALIELGASVRARDDYGNTPLIIAAARGNSALVATLIHAGAEPDARNGLGLTALMEASYWGHVEVVARLLKAGASINVRDNQFKTCLDWALEAGHAEVADMLSKQERQLAKRRAGDRP